MFGGSVSSQSCPTSCDTCLGGDTVAIMTTTVLTPMQKKPYTAITVQIDRLTSEQYEDEDLSGIIDLIEVIRIQELGPAEAARAIRKMIKYGNSHRQMRALTILDGLIQNAGSRFQRTFADEPLLERLRLLSRDPVVPVQVRRKCSLLFIQWANAYRKTPGLERIASLYQELPKSQGKVITQSKVLRETEQPDPDGEMSPTSPRGHTRASSSISTAQSPISPQRPVALSSPSSSSFSSKFSKMRKERAGKSFNLAKEKENMTTCIANASIASTNLLNGLQLISREVERPSGNQEVLRRFELCKTLRREILRFIQYVDSDEWIGSLVNANDELVKALTAFEIMDKSISDDSDSDAREHANTRPLSSNDFTKGNLPDIGGMSISGKPPLKSPRPTAIDLPSSQFLSPAHATKPTNDDNEDPFGDDNAAPSPRSEIQDLNWKEV